MTIQTAAIILVLVFVAGCSSTDVSKLEPFSSYVGQTVELRYPVAVVQRRSMWSAGSSGGVHSHQSAQYGLKAAVAKQGGAWLGSAGHDDQIFATLPIQHPVRIVQVLDEVFIDGEQIVAYGRTTIPPGTNEVTFAYAWGFMWRLERAPWEPDSVPEKRYPPGQLPSHFDYEPFRTPTNAPTWGTRKVEP